MSDERLGFTKVKRTGLDNVTYVDLEHKDFKVSASQFDVQIKGDLCITNMNQLQSLAKAVSDAWSEHSKLRAALRESLSL